MPQKQPPARTAVSWPGEEASGASTAGAGRGSLRAWTLVAPHCRAKSPKKISTENKMARMRIAPGSYFQPVYVQQILLDAPRSAPDAANFGTWQRERASYLTQRNLFAGES